MDLRDLPMVSDWLSQFEVPDIYLAEHMLRRLRYVGFEEFEAWLQVSVRGLLKEILEKEGRVAIAIFPVSKPFIHNFNINKEEKLPNDSAGRIAHSLKNIERDLPDYVELSPRLESMRKRKIRHIIFVDDFVGTGDRFTRSWRETVPPSIKSWCSRGWCKVWFLTFAAHASGLKRISRNVRPVSLQQIRANLTIERSFFTENLGMRAVLRKYGGPLGSVRQVMGYGGVASPIVFQHGCPNNVPLILWVRPSKASRVKWRPLFPDRSVSAELYQLFTEDWASQAMPEELWMAGNFDLALNVLEKLGQYKECHHLLLTLGLLARGHSVQKIRNTLVLDAADFSALLGELRAGGLLDSNNVVTRFGHDVIARATRPEKKNVITTKESNFYPSSFLGFQRGA